MKGKATGLLLAFSLGSGEAAANFDLILESSSMVEASGIDWFDDGMGKERFLIAGDEGALFLVDRDGTNGSYLGSASVDIEALAIPNHKGNIAYLGIEHNDIGGTIGRIQEYNFETQTFGGTYQLPLATLTEESLGLEALTYVSSTNTFYAGVQGTGDLYRFQLPTSGSDVVNLGFLTPETTYTELTGLYYDEARDLLFAGYDRIGSSGGAVLAMELDGTFVQEWLFNDQELSGLSLIDTTLFLVEDDKPGGKLRSQANFLKPLPEQELELDFESEKQVAVMPEASTYALLAAMLGLPLCMRRKAEN